MKNYLKAKWQSLRAWSSSTWKLGWYGKAKVVMVWYVLVAVAMAPITLMMPDVQLELRPAKTEPALICLQQQSFDEMIEAKVETNQALVEKFRHQPQVLTRIITSDNYMKRDAAAFQMMKIRKIARGQCREVTHGDPVTVAWTEWQSKKDADPFKPERMQVIYQEQRYWAYTGEWQKATGHIVAKQDRAPLMISRRSPEGSDRSAPPVVDEAQSTPGRRPVPPFSRVETYAHVRAVLMRQGWDPVVSRDADECMPDDSRCAGRPEMLTCSGSGLAMCRFRWRRDEQSLTICTAGEEQAMFHSVCE